MQKELVGEEHFSFTTDIWSSDNGHASLLSLMAHWVTSSFVRKSAVLHAESIYESHWCLYMSEIQRKLVFTSWDIANEKIHVILRDNGSNMVRAMKDASLHDIGCFAHTLQLAVHDGVLSQKAVISALSVCRKIVGHFQHSSLAYSKLAMIQESLGLPQHRLIQDGTQACIICFNLFLNRKWLLLHTPLKTIFLNYQQINLT